MYTTQQVARYLGISVRAVQKACSLGTLKAKRFGRDWFITEDAMEDYGVRYRRKPGRK